MDNQDNAPEGLDEFLADENPQAAVAAKGIATIGKSLLDSGPRTQDSIEPDYNSPVDLAAGAVGAGLGSAMARDAESIIGNEIGSIGKNIKPLNILSKEEVEAMPAINIPNEHIPADQLGQETANNYRLNNLPNIQYAVKDGKVVGHVGLDDANRIKGVYVDPEHRRQGIAKSLYNHLIKSGQEFGSDEPLAMEPETKQIWEQLKSENPNTITKTKEGYTYKPKDGLASHSNPEQIENSRTTQNIGKNLYKDEVAKANKNKKPKRFANGGRVPDDYEHKVKMADGGDAISRSLHESAAPIENIDTRSMSGENTPTDQEINQFIAPTNEEKYGTPGQQAIAGLEGAGEGVAGPFATAAETIAGVPKEDILGRREANPITHALGQGTGIAGSMFTGVGEGALVARGAARLVPEGMSVAARLGSAAGKAALENIAFQTGDETTRMIINDPNQSAQTAIADIGLAGLLGGVLGTSAEGVNALWSAKYGNKVGQFIEDTKAGLAEHIAGGNPVDHITQELSDLHNSITSHADEVYGASGLKARELHKVMPEMNDKIVGQVVDHVNKFEDSIAKMNAKPNSYPERLTSKIQSDLDAYKKVATDPNSSPADIFNATQDLKQTMQEYAKFDKFVKPVDEAYDFVRQAKSLSHDLRESLEDTKVWGKAAERQKIINKAFSEYLPTLKDFQKSFMSPMNGELVINPGKVQTFVNQIEKPSGKLKRDMLSNFIKASDKYKNVIGDTHANLGIESPIEHTSLHHLMLSLKDQTPGSKFAKYLVDKGIGETAGTGAGGLLGGLFGHPVLGAIAGKHSIAPFLNSVLPSLIKPMMEQAASHEGIRSAVDYGMAVARGDQLVKRASKALFKSGQMILPESAIPKDRDIEKLDKHLKNLRDNPQEMMHIVKGSEYLPNHDAAMTSSAQNAVNNLNSLRPNNIQQAPLDTQYPLSKVQKGQFREQLMIAQQPLLILNKIKNGSITLDDVKSVSNLYPALYSKLVNQMITDMTDHVTKHGVNSVPYKTRIGLSMFTGQPMDSTFTPGNIVSAQPQAQAAQQAPSQGSKQKGSPKALEKLPGSYSTPSQNRAKNQQTKD